MPVACGMDNGHAQNKLSIDIVLYAGGMVGFLVGKRINYDAFEGYCHWVCVFVCSPFWVLMRGVFWPRQWHTL